VVSRSVCWPHGSYPLVVLDHEVERLLAVRGNTSGAGVGKLTQELASLLGGVLVVLSGPSRGGLRSAGEVGIDAVAVPALEVVPECFSPGGETGEEFVVGEGLGPAQVRDCALDGRDDLLEAVAFGGEVFTVSPQRRQLVGVPVEDLLDLG